MTRRSWGLAARCARFDSWSMVESLLQQKTLLAVAVVGKRGGGSFVRRSVGRLVGCLFPFSVPVVLTRGKYSERKKGRKKMR